MSTNDINENKTYKDYIVAKKSKHVSKFETNHLKGNEQIESFGDGYIGEAMGQGDKAQHNGALIVTNERVVFYRKGLFGEIIETMPLVNITSIERKSLLGHRTINIHTSHDSLSFKTFSKESETALLDAIESGRNENSQKNNFSSSEQVSPLQKIKELGELKAAGVITEDEFTNKKNELLNKV